MKLKNHSRLFVSAIALLAALLATPAMADCFSDAKALYDSCVNFQYLLNNGTLLTASEEGCAEASAEATNVCLINAGKVDPGYSECRNRYDFYIPTGSNCPGGYWFTQLPHIDLEVRHLCDGYFSIRRTIGCN